MNDPKYAVLEALHRESSNNRATLTESTECGCFYCKRIFDPVEIIEWRGGSNGIGNDTAVCPYCKKGTVIGNDTIDICTEMLNDMHEQYYSTCRVKFEAETETTLNEYAELFFAVPEWEKGSCDKFQKQMRATAKNKTGKKVTTHSPRAATGLNGFSSPTKSLLLTAGGHYGQKPQVKSEDDLQQDLENFVLVTEICNGETIFDQQSAETLTASAWAMLLKRKPEYVKMCDTGKMSTADLMSIMIQTPTIAKHLDVSRLTSKEWGQLVKCQVKLRPLAVKYQTNQAS